MFETVIYKLIMTLITAFSLYKVHHIETFLYGMPEACKKEEYRVKHPDVCSVIDDTIKEEKL